MSEYPSGRDSGGEGSEAPPTAAPRPARVFIGSSHEGRKIAETIQLGISDEVEAVVWSQGAFELSRTPVESLERAASRYDFAVLVVTPDDPALKRGAPYMTPRDNVLFEIGLFMGVLGRDRTFVVCQRDASLAMPTDLAGITLALFSPPSNGNLLGALGPACTQIKNQILRVVGVPPARLLVEGGAAARSTPRVARRRRRKALGSARALFPPESHRIADISVSGALLETTRPLPVGYSLDLDLELNGSALAHVTAEVVRIQEPAWGQVGGIGVAFKRYTGRSRDIIEGYVDADPSAH